MTEQDTQEIKPDIERIKEFADQHDCNILVADGKIVFKKRSTIWSFFKEFFDGRRN